MPDVTLTPGTLPPPACYSSEQDRYEAYINTTTATVPSGYTQWITQDAEPGASDRDKIWLRTSSNVPVEALLWVVASSQWVRWFSLSKYSETAGVANAYTVTNAVAGWTAYRTGEILVVKASFTNTGTATLQVDALAAVTIVKMTGTALAAGDMESGGMYLLVKGPTYWHLMNPAGGTSFGISDINPGNDGDFARTRSGAATWEASLYATTTAAAQALPAAAGVVTFAHGLGQVPSMFGARFVCTDAGGDLAYTQGDEVLLECAINAINVVCFSVKADATNITVRRVSTAATIQLPNSTTGTYAAITEADWKLKAWAMK